MYNVHLYIYKVCNDLNFKISQCKIIITILVVVVPIKRTIDNNTTQSYLNIYRVDRYAITIIYVVL